MNMNIKSTLALSIIADVLMWYRSMTLELYYLYLLIGGRFALRGEQELMREVFWDMQQEFCSDVKNGVNMWDRNFRWTVLHIISDYRTACGNTDANLSQRQFLTIVHKQKRTLECLWKDKLISTNFYFKSAGFSFSYSVTRPIL